MKSCKARRSLGLGLQKTLIGREEEIAKIEHFTDSHIKNYKAGCLYISGLPGTGKTASVHAVLKKIEAKHDVGVVRVNCMELNVATDLYKRVFSSIGEPLCVTPSYGSRGSSRCSSRAESPRVGGSSGGSKKRFSPRSSVENFASTPAKLLRTPRTPRTPSSGGKNASVLALQQRLEDLFCNSEEMIILCLDEMDQLITNSNYLDTLYTVFKWPTLEGSKLLLIGIANAIDLTDRLLPKLKVQNGSLAPKCINFAPYTKEQVVEILKFRLTDVDNALTPAAIEICARKVSALTGDIRKALELCKSALGKTQQDFVPITDSNNGEERLIVVEPKHILDTIGQVYGAHDNGRTSTMHCLPLHQKLVLAVFIRLTESKCTASFSVAEVYTCYKATCFSCKLPTVDQSEVEYVCQLLDALGYIRRTGAASKKTEFSRSTRYGLNKDLHAAKRVLNDENMLTSVLQIC